MENLLERPLQLLTELWTDAMQIWVAGGWAMPAIALIAFATFAIGIRVALALRHKGHSAVPEESWRLWIDAPEQRTGPIGELLDFVTGGATAEDMAFFFRQLRKTETVSFERDLRVMRICVSAAPLVGLLGTVTGMLSTFDALATGSGGDQTMDMVAQGISEALITTETGLVVAIPGLFFQYQLARRLQHYKAFLAHIESVCLQGLHRGRRDELRRAHRAAARVEIARSMRARLDAALPTAKWQPNPVRASRAPRERAARGAAN